MYIFLLLFFKLNFGNRVTSKVIDIGKRGKISLFDVAKMQADRGFYIRFMRVFLIFACKCTSLLYSLQTIHFIWYCAQKSDTEKTCDGYSFTLKYH